MTTDIPYNRKAVDPVGCIKAGWELIKPHYWLFVGMVFIGYAIGQAVPILLTGPMMAGLFIVFFAARRREPIEFSTVFKGFDFFAPSLVATLIHVIPIAAIVIPAYLLFYVSLFVAIASQGQSQNPNPAGVLGVFFTFFLVLMVIFVAIVVISVGFIFTYPLIVDRRLNGLEAVKWSFKAAMANFWRLLAMMLLTGILNFIGVACCIVGMFLVLPIVYGAIAAAYEQVFGLNDTREFAPDLPPPPPVFN